MISIIIPVYNAMPYLPQCLESLAAQTFTDWELLLADDASTDESGAECDRWAQRDERIHVLHLTQNGGASAARNAALSVARGEYVAFADADDVVHARYLEILYEALGRTGCDVAASAFRIVPSSQRADFTVARLQQSVIQRGERRLTGHQALLDMLYQRGGIDSSPCCKLFRRTLFDTVRFPAQWRVYEDLYTLAQIYQTAQKVTLVDVETYFYFKQASGTLSSLSCLRHDVFELLADLEARFTAAGDTALARACRERRLSVSFHTLRLLRQAPVSDGHKLMAQTCRQHIKVLRGESLRDPQARPKNRLVAALSYLFLF